MTTDAGDLSRDFEEIRDITVIGAGPVGLSTAFWAGMREASARIIDSLPDIGGQLTTLYPEKWIFDVPGYPRVLARDLVDRLREQTLEQFDVPVHLETTAERISWEPDPEDPERRTVARRLAAWIARSRGRRIDEAVFHLVAYEHLRERIEPILTPLPDPRAASRS